MSDKSFEASEFELVGLYKLKSFQITKFGMCQTAETQLTDEQAVCMMAMLTMERVALFSKRANENISTVELAVPELEGRFLCKIASKLGMNSIELIREALMPENLCRSFGIAETERLKNECEKEAGLSVPDKPMGVVVNFADAKKKSEPEDMQ